MLCCSSWLGLFGVFVPEDVSPSLTVCSAHFSSDCLWNEAQYSVECSTSSAKESLQNCSTNLQTHNHNNYLVFFLFISLFLSINDILERKSNQLRCTTGKMLTGNYFQIKDHFCVKQMLLLVSPGIPGLPDLCHKSTKYQNSNSATPKPCTTITKTKLILIFKISRQYIIN